MKPFILQSVKFDNKKMVVRAYTDCGVYEFLVLPPSKDQNENYVIRFEDGKYVIRTKDYERLKRGDYTIVEEIKLAHEVTHLDERVICPIYSLGRIIAENYLDFESREKAKGMGLSIIFRFDNFFEDVFSKKLLIKLGFNKEDVEKTIPADKGFNEIVKLYCKFIEEMGYESLGNIIKREDNPFKNLQKIFFKSFEERIEYISEIYTLFDIIIMSQIYKLNLASIKNLIKLQTEQREYVKKRAKTETDPLWKLRWELEMERLDKQFSLTFSLFKRFLSLFKIIFLKSLRIIK
ncbi:hypothetical protein DRP04_08435 [Archaeoglobales archaeon]|nr:MAG: hypothetical protein DRP04_08435 [Archaeoglobales archaeon]